MLLPTAVNQLFQGSGPEKGSIILLSESWDSIGLNKIKFSFLFKKN